MLVAKLQKEEQYLYIHAVPENTTLQNQSQAALSEKEFFREKVGSLGKSSLFVILN